MRKKSGNFFRLFFFLNCPQKGAKGDAVYSGNSLKVFVKRMKQKRPPEKK